MVSNERIIFFGFGDVGQKCLKFLLENDYNVVAVFTHDTDPHEANWFDLPEKLAKDFFIPVFKPPTLKTQKWFRKVRYLKPDLILSIYYRNFIPEEIFSQARLGAYNMHGSYLPSYRGRAPLNWSIINGEDHCGVSLHVMEKSFDTGDIVCQQKVPFGPEEYVGQIQPRVAQAAVDVLKSAIGPILSGKPNLVKQDCSKASYFGKRTPEDGRIDFSKSARAVFNLIRGVSKPFPGAFTEIDGKKLIIWRAKIGESANGCPPGTLLSKDPFRFACSDNIIEAEDFEFAQ